MPPIYWSTGIHRSAASGRIGAAARGLQNRAKYHELSTKVSNVSVSRTAAAPQAGQATCFQLGCRSSGLPGWSNATSSGSRTGSCSSGTATTPHAAQWIIGIGQPQ